MNNKSGSEKIALECTRCGATTVPTKYVSYREIQKYQRNHHTLCNSSPNHPIGASGGCCSCRVVHNSEWRGLQKLCEEQRSDNETLKNENELLIRRFNDTFGQFYGMDEQLHYVITTERERADKLEVRVRELDARVEEQKGEIRELMEQMERGLDVDRMGVQVRMLESQLARLNLVLEGYKVMAGLSTTDHLKAQGMIQKELEEQKGEIAELKHRSEVCQKFHGESFSMDRHIELMEAHEKSLSQLATQTERARVMREALGRMTCTCSDEFIEPDKCRGYSWCHEVIAKQAIVQELIK